MTDIRARAEQLLNFATERGRGWETRTERGELTRVVHSGEWEGSLARCCDCNVEAGFPNHDDAEFIAAAPGLVRDLLDALTDALTVIAQVRDTEGWDDWDRAVAAEEALAKVEDERDRLAAELRRTTKERDEARAAIERVRKALSDHPRCEKHPDDDVISCGWKRAVLDVHRALDGGETP